MDGFGEGLVMSESGEESSNERIASAGSINETIGCVGREVLDEDVLSVSVSVGVGIASSIHAMYHSSIFLGG